MSKSFKKIYWKIFYILINLFVVFGIVSPYLISAKSTELVLLGIILILTDLSHLIFFIKSLIKTLIK